MNDMTWPRGDLRPDRRGRTADFVVAPALGVLGGALSLLLLVGALGVAVVFAATLAVVLALAVVLTALSAAAWRVRPRPALAAMRAGHAWVRYGAERSLR